VRNVRCFTFQARQHTYEVPTQTAETIRLYAHCSSIQGKFNAGEFKRRNSSSLPISVETHISLKGDCTPNKIRKADLLLFSLNFMEFVGYLETLTALNFEPAWQKAFRDSHSQGLQTGPAQVALKHSRPPPPRLPEKAARSTTTHFKSKITRFCTSI
jgi:hypothetical protein